MKKLSFLAALFLHTTSAFAHPPAMPAKPACGGDLGQWLRAMAQEAKEAGVRQKTIDKLTTASIDQRVLKRDRAQGIFNLTFADFSNRLISRDRLEKGKSNLQKYYSSFARAEEVYGVPAPVITAFWRLETDYGAIQGDFDTLNALFTLSYDCRRPELFRPQLIALLKLIDQGVIHTNTTGAWAGEIGQMQLLPRDYLERGVDGDGDGKVDLKNSVPDAVMTAARILSDLGWKRGKPWLEEVRLTRTDMPWHEAKRSIRKSRAEWAALGVRYQNGTALDNNAPDAALILPMGGKGPAFLASENFDIFVVWNRSIVYATTAAYFATRLSGADAFIPGRPDTGLSLDEAKALQEKLIARGYDIGQVDGIIGQQTRDAVTKEQLRLNISADSWPTKELLNKI